MPEPKSVLFVIPTLGGGGAERVVVTLLRNLDRARFRPVLATSLARGATFRDHLPSDLEVIELGERRLRYALPRLLEKIWRLNPALVFSTIDYLNVALASTRIVWPPKTALVVRPALTTMSVPASQRLAMRLVLPWADAAILQSRAMESEFRQALGWRKPNTIVLNNPVDVRRVRHLAADPAVLPRYRPDAVNLVAAGRLHPQKGFDLLFRALASIERPDVRLTLLGEGPEEGRLKALAAELGLANRIAFVGFQSNPYPFMARADAFVLSSRFEGFPNAVLEALACGTNVIASPVSGLPEILRNTPGCFVAASSDVANLGEALREFLREPRHIVPADAVSDFDTTTAVAAYADCFDSVIARIRRR